MDSPYPGDFVQYLHDKLDAAPPDRVPRRTRFSWHCMAHSAGLSSTTLTFSASNVCTFIYIIIFTLLEAILGRPPSGASAFAIGRVASRRLSRFSSNVGYQESLE